MEAITAEEARALLKQEEDDRLAKCAADIEEVLKRHGCQVVAVPQLTPDGRIVADVKLVAA